jgi:hypothetical protein
MENSEEKDLSKVVVEESIQEKEFLPEVKTSTCESEEIKFVEKIIAVEDIPIDTTHEHDTVHTPETVLTPEPVLTPETDCELIKLLKFALDTSEKTDTKLDIKLSSALVSILKLLLEKNKEIFIKLDKIICDAKKDDKFDLTEIIMIYKELYEVLFKLKVKKVEKQTRAEVCAILLRFIFNTTIDENLTQINKFIDIASTMTDLRKSLKKTYGSCKIIERIMDFIM